MGLTDFVAWIGALSGLSSVTWNFIQWRQNRPSLKVTAGIRTMVSGSEIQGDVLMVKMVNTGKRPIRISMASGATTDGNFLIKPIRLPITLEEAQEIIEPYPVEGKSDLLLKYKLISLYVTDSLDRKWSVSQKEIEEINQAISKMKSK